MHFFFFPILSFESIYALEAYQITVAGAFFPCKFHCTLVEFGVCAEAHLGQDLC